MVPQQPSAGGNATSGDESSSMNATGTEVVNATMLNSTSTQLQADADTSSEPTLANATIGDNSTAPADNSTAPIANVTETNMTSGGNATETPITPAPTPSPSGNMINCCDFYQKGSGYEFSVCDGVGALIRPELVGAERDTFYLNQQVTPADMSLGLLWQDFTGVINNYCDARTSNVSGNNSTLTFAYIWQNLGIDWNQWAAIPMNSIEDIRLWFGNYQQWLQQAIDWLKNNFPNTPIEAQLRDQLYQIDPKWQTSNITF